MLIVCVILKHSCNDRDRVNGLILQSLKVINFEYVNVTKKFNFSKLAKYSRNHLSFHDFVNSQK